MSRPTKLTPARIKRLTNAIRAGNYYDAACAYAGIAYSTFRNWITTAEAAIENGTAEQPENAPFVEFLEDVKKAEADAEVRMVGMWQKQIPHDWKAAATFLERRHPDKWGRRAPTDGDAADDEIKVVVHHIPAGKTAPAGQQAGEP